MVHGENQAKVSLQPYTKLKRRVDLNNQNGYLCAMARSSRFAVVVYSVGSSRLRRDQPLLSLSSVVISAVQTKFTYEALNLPGAKN